MSTLAPFFDRINAVGPLKPASIKAVEAAFEIIKPFKKELLLQPGEICRYMYFVLKGLVRVYYYADGKEITSRLMNEGFFITSFISFYTGNPGNEYMEAYEDCVLARIQTGDLNRIYKTCPDICFAGRALTDFSFFLSEERTVALRNTTAAHRVAFFLRRHSDLLNRVTNKHIASYLGIEPETFSREKKRLLAGK